MHYVEHGSHVVGGNRVSTTKAFIVSSEHPTVVEALKVLAAGIEAGFKPTLARVVTDHGDGTYEFEEIRPESLQGSNGASRRPGGITGVCRVIGEGTPHGLLSVEFVAKTKLDSLVAEEAERVSKKAEKRKAAALVRWERPPSADEVTQALAVLKRAGLTVSPGPVVPARTQVAQERAPAPSIDEDRLEAINQALRERRVAAEAQQLAGKAS